MICPHCGIGTSPIWRSSTMGQDAGRQFDVNAGNCTECKRLILVGRTVRIEDRRLAGEQQMLIFPPRTPPRPIPEDVTGEYAEDFREACMVLEDSPKASAALSRRLLQHIIREKAGIKKGSLNDEIDALIETNILPADLAHDLDMIRTVGNFAAHPIKSTATGEVVNVEPGEAEALLDLVEELLDFYFVRPARREAKRQALNEKLAAAGKDPLKGTSEPEDPPQALGST